MNYWCNLNIQSIHILYIAQWQQRDSYSCMMFFSEVYTTTLPQRLFLCNIIFLNITWIQYEIVVESLESHINTKSTCA